MHLPQVKARDIHALSIRPQRSHRQDGSAGEGDDPVADVSGEVWGDSAAVGHPYQRPFHVSIQRSQPLRHQRPLQVWHTKATPTLRSRKVAARS
jgi:hypothetical protein